MRLSLLFFWVVFILPGMSGCSTDQGAKEVYLFRNGKSAYEIIVSNAASGAEKKAASELQKYLKEMTGFTLPILTDNTREEGKTEILIGKTNRENGDFVIDRKTLGADGFQILTSGKRLAITGGGDRGTLYGVYSLLESFGCRFFAVGVESIPKVKKLTVSLPNPLIEKPAFEYRDVFWSPVFDTDISLKLKINGTHTNQGAVQRYIPQELGGGVRFTKPHLVHTFHYLIPAAEYFEKHPEYFSEINGQRKCDYLYTQLCLTNPDVLRMAIDTVKTWLREDPEGSIVSVSQDDSYIIESYCTCKACAAIDAEEESHAGTLLRFVNAVADAVKEDFPDATIETLAYQYSLKPPKITKPRENVIIRLCTGGCSAHPIEQCPQNAGPKSNIINWSKICNRLYIWDYTTNFAHYLTPVPNLNNLQPNARFFAENNVKGVFEQGNYQGGKSGEFGELRAYMLAKLLWDPYTDIETHKQEFLDGYYGSASPFVKEYIETIHGFFEPADNHFGINFHPAELFNKHIPDALMAHFDSLWEQAKKAADNEDVADRVKRSEIQYRYYKLTAGRGEFTDEAKKTQFYQDCHRLGVTQINEGALVPPVLPE